MSEYYHLEPFIEEVDLDDDEIRRMIREEAANVMDPETKLISVENLDAIVSIRLSLEIERRLRETYPHLFDSEADA